MLNMVNNNAFFYQSSYFCGMNKAFVNDDVFYMGRALELARRGAGFVSPNPMVGALVVADGRVIGQGWHRRWGGPHAEVNAIKAVNEADRCLLPESTVYVTLEPCSHYGKTPPCAKLLIDSGVKRVVVGAPDPFIEVRGRGVKMLRQAGIEVTEGVLLQECMELNKRFMTAHTLHRPWVILKWAQSADGFLAARGVEGEPRPVRLSDALTSVLVHRERAMVDAIMVGSTTVVADNPRLDVRSWPARKNPLRVTIDRRNRLADRGFNPGDCACGCRQAPLPAETLVINECADIRDLLSSLYCDKGITSLMVEGGAELLTSFIDEELFDEIRVETSPQLIGSGVKAPRLPQGLTMCGNIEVRKQLIEVFRR